MGNHGHKWGGNAERKRDAVTESGAETRENEGQRVRLVTPLRVTRTCVCVCVYVCV